MISDPLIKSHSLNHHGYQASRNVWLRHRVVGDNGLTGYACKGKDRLCPVARVLENNIVEKNRKANMTEFAASK